jgi:hypothetical protein
MKTNLELVLESRKVLDELKRELIRWNYEVDKDVIPQQAIEKVGSFYVRINEECTIWVLTDDILQQVNTAEMMKFILDNSNKYSLAEVIEQIEYEEGEECKEYRKIAEDLDEDIAPYEEA